MPDARPWDGSFHEVEFAQVVVGLQQAGQVVIAHHIRVALRRRGQRIRHMQAERGQLFRVFPSREMLLTASEV